MVTPFINSSDVRLIIFDLHGTLTGRTSIHPYHIRYRNQYIERVSGRAVPADFNVGTDEAFALFPGLSKQDYYHFRDNDPTFLFEQIHDRNPDLAKKLLVLGRAFHLALYTDSYLKQIDRTLLAMGVDNVFEFVIGVDQGNRKSSAEFTVYPGLCETLGIRMNQMLIVGDRMDKDIDPVLRIGGSGILVHSSDFILNALEYILETLNVTRK